MAATSIKIKIGTINCQGIKTNVTKRRLIFDLVKLNKIDILLLQETNLRSHEEKKIKAEWGQGPCIFSSSHDNQPASGVAILCRGNDFEIIDPLFDAEGKLLATDITVRGDRIHIVNVHLPSSPSRSTFEPAITELHVIMQSPYPTILGGDFNFVENAAIDRLPPPQTDYQSFVRRPWGEFKNIYNLRDIAENIRPPLFTREQNNSFSRIDKFYTVPQIASSNPQVKSIGYGDHRMFYADFTINPAKKRGRGRFKCNVKVHSRPDFLQEIEQIITSSSNDTTYRHHPGNWWNKCKKKIA